MLSHIAVKAGYERKWLFAKDALDGGAVFVDLFGLAHDLVDGGGIGEGAFGVEPPLLHAKNRVAANLVRIGRKQCVVEALQLSCRSSRAAGNHASQRGVRKQAASQHYVARSGIGLHQRIHVLKIKDVAVVGHRERRPLQRLAVKLFARRTRIAILLHARMHDQLRQRHAAIEVEHALVLLVVLQSQPGLDRDGQWRALAHVAQEQLELIQVAQKARTLPLGNNRARGAAKVEIDLAVTHVGEHLRRPHKLVRVLGHQLRHHVEPLVIGGIDLFKRLTAKAVAHARRRQKRRVITIECAEALRVHATEHMPGNPLHRGQR